MSWHDSAECGLCLCRRLNRKGNFRKVDVANDLFITSTTLYNFNFAPLLHQHSSCLVGSMNCGKRGNLLTWSSTTTTKPCWNQAARRRGYLDHPDGHCGIRSSLPLYVDLRMICARWLTILQHRSPWAPSSSSSKHGTECRSDSCTISNNHVLYI